MTLLYFKPYKKITVTVMAGGSAESRQQFGLDLADS